MKNTHATLKLLCLFALLCTNAAAQNAAPQVKHFSDKGLSLDYPSDFSLEDQSKEGGQNLVLTKENGAQIMVISGFDAINSPEQLEKARHDVADKFTDSMFEELKKVGRAERKDAQIEIAGTKAQGTRLTAVLADGPGAAEIYWLLLGKRLVLVTLIGSDKEIAAAANAWALVRSSLKIVPATAFKRDAVAPTLATEAGR